MGFQSKVRRSKVGGVRLECEDLASHGRLGTEGGAVAAFAGGEGVGAAGTGLGGGKAAGTGKVEVGREAAAVVVADLAALAAAAARRAAGMPEGEIMESICSIGTSPQGVMMGRGGLAAWGLAHTRASCAARVGGWGAEGLGPTGSSEAGC